MEATDLLLLEEMPQLRPLLLGAIQQPRPLLCEDLFVAIHQLLLILLGAIQQLRPLLFDALFEAIQQLRFLRFKAIQPILQRSIGTGVANVHIAPVGMDEAYDAFGEAIIRSGNSLE